MILIECPFCKTDTDHKKVLCHNGYLVPERALLHCVINLSEVHKALYLQVEHNNEMRSVVETQSGQIRALQEELTALKHRVFGTEES